LRAASESLSSAHNDGRDVLVGAETETEEILALCVHGISIDAI
jgi:hypothetical protein